MTLVLCVFGVTITVVALLLAFDLDEPDVRHPMEGPPLWW